MSGTENFNDYPKHPGQTTPRPYFVEIPLETFETMSEELAELRKHELAWDLDKARIKELEAENESLKYSVATLDTDIAMMKRWRKVSEELPNDGEPGNVDTVLVAVEIRTIDGVQYREETAFYMDGKFWMTQKKRSTFDKEDFGGYGYLIQKVTHWMPLPKAPKEA